LDFRDGDPGQRLIRAECFIATLPAPTKELRLLRLHLSITCACWSDLAGAGALCRMHLCICTLAKRFVMDRGVPHVRLRIGPGTGFRPVESRPSTLDFRHRAARRRRARRIIRREGPHLFLLGEILSPVSFSPPSKQRGPVAASGKAIHTGACSPLARAILQTASSTALGHGCAQQGLFLGCISPRGQRVSALSAQLDIAAHKPTESLGVRVLVFLAPLPADAITLG